MVPFLLFCILVALVWPDVIKGAFWLCVFLLWVAIVIGVIYGMVWAIQHDRYWTALILFLVIVIGGEWADRREKARIRAEDRRTQED